MTNGKTNITQARLLSQFLIDKAMKAAKETAPVDAPENRQPTLYADQSREELRKRLKDAKRLVQSIKQRHAKVFCDIFDAGLDEDGHPKHTVVFYHMNKLLAEEEKRLVYLLLLIVPFVKEILSISARKAEEHSDGGAEFMSIVVLVIGDMLDLILATYISSVDMFDEATVEDMLTRPYLV